jgi:hypothetical protein
LQVLRYFSIIQRLLLTYKNPQLAKLYQWHADNSMDGNSGFASPIDGLAWKHAREKFSDKMGDKRSLGLVLGMDGVGPFHKTGFAAPYSIWPVVMTTYNMPPFLATKQGYSWLVMLLPGEYHL